MNSGEILSMLMQIVLAEQALVSSGGGSIPLKVSAHSGRWDFRLEGTFYAKRNDIPKTGIDLDTNINSLLGDSWSGVNDVVNSPGEIFDTGDLSSIGPYIVGDDGKISPMPADPGLGVKTFEDEVDVHA